MNRLLSIILSLADELIPFFRPSNRKGFVSLIFVITANSIPIIGVVFLKWNPFMILFIYWGESLIIGFFNLLKMFISGIIENHKVRLSEFRETAGLCVFFIFHYGIFMLVHGIFIFAFMVLSLTMESKRGGRPFDAYTFLSLFLPGRMSLAELFESEYSAITALFISHAVSFFMYFIKTGEYNYTRADTYMMRPYRRIFIMHMTIIFGAFALWFSGFRSAVFIIVWIGVKILFDLKIHVSEMKNYGFGDIPGSSVPADS